MCLGRGVFQLVENPIAHLGGGGVGEGNGDDLAGFIHLAQQLKKAAGEQFGFRPGDTRAAEGLVIGGDGALGDIGFQNVSKVMLQNRPNVKMMMLDTQVYSNTGGQNSDS